MYSAFALMEDSPGEPLFCLDILNPYKCQYCRFTTDFKVAFYCHLRTFHDKKQINCDLHQIFECSKCKNCNFNTHSALVLQTHINNCNYERTFQKRRKSTTMKVQWFKCDQCNFKTKLESDLKKHRMTVGHNDKLKMSHPPKLVSPVLFEKNKDIQSRNNMLKSPKFLLVFKKNKQISNEPKLISAGLLEKSRNHNIRCSPGSSIFSENVGNIQEKKFDCPIAPQTCECKYCVYKHHEKIVTSIYHKGKRFDSLSDSLFGYYKCENCNFHTDAAPVMLKHKQFRCKQRLLEQETSKHLLDHTYSMQRPLKQENTLQVLTKCKKPMILTNEAFKELNPFRCPRCSFKASTTVGFKNRNFYRCPRCYFQAQAGGSLNVRMTMLRRYEFITALKCKLCSYQCNYHHQLRDHILITHNYFPLNNKKAL